jgi:hypothetical protein
MDYEAELWLLHEVATQNMLSGLVPGKEELNVNQTNFIENICLGFRLDGPAAFRWYGH